MFIIGCAAVFGNTLTITGIAAKASASLISIAGGNKYVFLLMVNIILLAFGDEPTITQAMAITRRAGQVIQHALMEDGIGFCYRLHQQHELDFKAFNMYQRKDFELICDALAEGKMDLSHFVTQRYPIEQFKEAIEMADKRPEPVLKVMMDF